MTKSKLSFATLREANLARLPTFKNAQGLPAHDKADGSDWTPADWLVAVTGELGEAANLMKKLKRGDFPAHQIENVINDELADEFADVATYLDLLAAQFGIDLGAAIHNKFNRVSRRVSSPVFINDTYEVAIIKG